MTRHTRKVLITVAISLAVLIVIVVVAAIRIVQTQWFRGYVAQKIIAAADTATGGRTEIGSFTFDWRHLEAEVTDFVIHGNEPPGAAPFIRIPTLRVNLSLFTSIHHIVDFRYLGLDQPQVNVMVLADGRSNVPSPKPAPSSGKPPLQSLVNAAIGHFDLNHGTVAFADAKQMLDLHCDNLRAELFFNTLDQGYKGQLSFQPLYAVSDRNTPVAFTVNLPVSIQSDKVSVNGATIATPASNLRIDGSIQNLRNPELSAHVTGQIALADLKNAGNLPLTLGQRDVPAVADVDADAAVSSTTIQVIAFHLSAGQSEIEASGRLKDPQGRGSMQFMAQVALDQAGRLLNVSGNPSGTVALSGTAKLDEANNFDVNGNIEARNVSVQEGSRRIDHVGLSSAVHVDPHNANLTGLRLTAFGGVLEGDASLQDFARYQFHGNLNRLSLQSVAAALSAKQPYTGTISGPINASGDLKNSEALSASARLSIAPGSSGIPVSGRLDADYSAAANDLRVDHSYVAMPHTRLSFSGSALRQLDISVTTTDANDLLAAASQSGTSPVNLQGHPAVFTGAITGGIRSPQITGHLRANSFSVEGRMFDSLALDASASSRGVSLDRGELTRGTMQAQFSAKLGLAGWKITPQAPIGVNADIRNSDLADVLALAGRPEANTSGSFNASAQVSGTIGNPSGSASFTAMNGAVLGEPFDRMQAQATLADQLIAIPSASVDYGNSHLALSAEFRHPRDSFSTGRIQAHVQSNQIDLARIRLLQERRPNTAGSLEINTEVVADVGGRGPLAGGRAGPVQASQFQIENLNATVAARGLQFDGQNYGDLNLNARSGGQNVQYQVVSTFAGSNIRVDGDTKLQSDYPTTLNAAISNLRVERVLAAAQRTDIPAKGTLSGMVHFSGTTREPAGSVDMSLTNAALYSEPINSLRAKADYQPTRAIIEDLSVSAPGAQVSLTAEFDHLVDDLKAGHIQFRVNNSNVDLARLHAVQIRRPGLGGMLHISAEGSADLVTAQPRIELDALDANLTANGITASGKNLGDATLTAETRNRVATLTLMSNLAGASIQGRATAQLNRNYPVNAQVSFSKVDWGNLQSLLQPANAPQNSLGQPTFNAGADGQITVQGPAANPQALNGTVQLTRLEFSSAIANRPGAAQLSIQNQGPIAASMNNGEVRIQSAHLAGSGSDIQAAGSYSLKNRSMDLRLNADADLAVLETLSRDIASSGKVVVAVTARGPVSKPAVNGSVQLQNVSFNDTQLPNGISKANGTVEFNGTAASLRNLTAESGGGKVTLSGFLLLASNPQFALRATTTGVRVDVQQGVSIVANSNLNLSGTRAASVLSGTVAITRINYAPKTDLGDILTRAAPSVQPATAPSPLLDNMKLEVQVQTSSALQIQSSLAQSLQGDANLRVRGSVSHPSVLGRVELTGGTVTFFGNSYTVDSGSISFFNPFRIEPILDVSLETNTQGVDVTLRVTGPIDNMKLSYTSNPPLRFEEIVNLLAVGKTPTSDPTLLANNPSPPQSVSEMGESALLSQAVANPLANSLQRVFGVSELKISPSFTNGSSTPTAQITLQQQITSNLTFTYITDVNNANAETIRVEMTLNPQWSAAATRDEFGMFSINLYYKRQFR